MGGQVSRRTAVVNFSKKVVDVDQNLDKKLEKEIPIIMKMCITGYLWAVNRYGDKGIWKILSRRNWHLSIHFYMKPFQTIIQKFLCPMGTAHSSKKC